MHEQKVVTCFLVFEGKVLLLKRSQRVGSYQGRWAGVAGYIEGQRSPEEQGLIEILEETSLPAAAVRLARSGEILAVEDPALNTRWLVHPLKWDVLSLDGFGLDWEHTECQWFNSNEIQGLETVPGLYFAWESVK